MTTMPDYAETIAAFVDGEPVLPDALTDALARAEGRELLVELLALRDVVAIDSGAAPAHAAPVSGPRKPWLILASAAAMVLLILTGYAAGVRRGSTRAAVAPPAAAIDRPPAPTVVVTVERWQETQKGGGS